MVNHLKDYFHQCWKKNKKKKKKKKVNNQTKKVLSRAIFFWEKTYYTLQGKKVFPFN